MLRPVLALVIVFTFLTVSGTYLGARLISPLRLRPPVAALAWAALAFSIALSAAGPLATAFLRRETHVTLWVHELLSLSYVLMGFLSFLLAFVVFEDLLLLFFRLLRLLPFSWEEKLGFPALKSALDTLHIHWRAVRSGRALFFIAALVATVVGMYQAHRPRTVVWSLPVKGLSPELEGFRIAMVSDLHAGLNIDRHFVTRIVDQVNALDPDIFVLVGDVADGFADQTAPEVEPLRNVRTRFGSFYVTGNHEYYWGAQEWMSALQQLGYYVLMNENRVITKGQAQVVVGGVPDVQGERFFPSHVVDTKKSLASLSENLKKSAVKILLAHNPRVAAEGVAAGYDIQLSGHTHGGQFFPWNLVIRLIQPYVAGDYEVGKMLLYVSRGTGYWGPPLRLGAPSEVTLLTLHGDTTGN